MITELSSRNMLMLTYYITNEYSSENNIGFKSSSEEIKITKGT